MKIAMVLPSISRLGGGVSEVVHNLTKVLCEHEIKIVIFAAHDEHYLTDLKRWTHVSLCTTRRFGPKSFSYQFGLIKNIYREEFDVIHVHGVWEYGALIAKIIAWMKKKPYVISPHGMLDSWALAKARVKKKIIFNLYAKYLISGATCVHALTNREAESVIRITKTKQIKIIPNGVFLDTNRFKQKKFLSTNVNKLLFLGRIDPKKSVYELIIAFESFLSKGKTNWILELVGWGDQDYVDLIKRTIANSVYKNSIIYHGSAYEGDKERFLSEATAFILPSKSEGLPMAVLEAWSFGLPVIMSNECNLPFAWNDQSIALKCGTDSLSICETLVELSCMDDYALDNLSKSSFMMAEVYAWKSLAVHYIEMYASLLKRDS